MYAVASSDDSVVSAARLNAHMVMFADRPWPLRMPAIEKHRELVRQMHGTEARPPLLADFCVCVPTLDGAEEAARGYMGKFVESNFYHYELLGGHFSAVQGYDAYAQKIAMAREIGMDGIVSAFMEAAVWGTPDRISRSSTSGGASSATSSSPRRSASEGRRSTSPNPGSVSTPRKCSRWCGRGRRWRGCSAERRGAGDGDADVLGFIGLARGADGGRASGRHPLPRVGWRYALEVAERPTEAATRACGRGPRTLEDRRS